MRIPTAIMTGLAVGALIATTAAPALAEEAKPADKADDSSVSATEQFQRDAEELGDATVEAAEDAADAVSKGAEDAYEWTRKQAEGAYEWSKEKVGGDSK